MSVIWSILLLAIVAYSILGWTLYFLQPSLLYRPVRDMLWSPADIGLTFQKVSLRTPDSIKLAAWYIPAPGARYTVLFCHGNGGNISHRLDTINIIQELGLNCLIFDYRGYGKSHGIPTEEGTYTDSMTAWKWLTEILHTDPRDIIIFGRSLGGSIAARLAAKVNPAGLMLESAFTSYEDMGKIFYPYMPVHWFASFKYRTIDYIKDVRCPLQMIHSRHDELIPFDFALRIYDSANNPKEFMEIEGSHNDGFLFSGQTYKNGWQQLIDNMDTQKEQQVIQLKKCSRA